MDNLDLLLSSPTEARITASPKGRSTAPAAISAFPTPVALDSIPLADLQPVGVSLFNALTTDSGLRDLFVANLAAAQPGDLRLRLQIDPPELRRLPWEALYREPGGFVALADLSISRYIAVGAQINRPVVTQLPLKILVASAAPSELPKLNFEAERKNLADALSDEDAKGWVKLEFIEHAKRQSVRDALKEFRPHVFHFSGHGHFSDEKASLAFEDSYGDTDPITPDDAAVLFGGLPELRLVVLNACETAIDSTTQPLTGIAPKILQSAGVPAVVAMQAPILDRAAIAFSRAFYNQLAQGRTVDEAMREGRLAIYNAVTSSAYFAVPVLFLSADEGLLIEFPQQRKDRVVAQARKGFEAVRAAPLSDATTSRLSRWQIQLGAATALYKKLAAWKMLHDYLHEMNEMFDFVVREIPRIDKNDPDFSYLADRWSDCQPKLRELASFARRDAAPITTQPLAETNGSLAGDPWIIEVIIAQRALDSALNESSLKAVVNAVRKFRQTIQIHMNAADKAIEDNAAELRRLSGRWADDKGKPGADGLAAAIGELVRLHTLLYEAVEKHDLFQDLDNAFVQLREEARRPVWDWDAVGAIWTFCRSNVLDSRFIPLAQESSEMIVNDGTLSGSEWCVSIVRLANNFDSQAAAREQAAVRNTIHELDQAIRTHFFLADKELKELTMVLNSLSDDLLEILKSSKRWPVISNQ